MSPSGQDFLIVLKWSWSNGAVGEPFASKPLYSLWSKDSSSINTTTLKVFGVLFIYTRSDLCDQKDLCNIFRNVNFATLLTETEKTL